MGFYCMHATPVDPVLHTMGIAIWSQDGARLCAVRKQQKAVDLKESKEGKDLAENRCLVFVRPGYNE
ncbi:hypothetical protein ANO11243_055610 [Dothideomycetidae sp. 11243]|nr:hypothetical protein ANO11243_055610 [fungal sp. No.11243]